VQLIGNGGVLGIPDLNTFNSWGYSFGKVVPANAADKAMNQTGVMVVRTPGQLSPTGTVNPACTVNCGNQPPATVGPLSVSLSSSNPSSGTIVQGQVAAPLASFTFSGNSTVVGVTLQRTGVSSNNLLKNVYLYSGAQRLTDSASVNSNGAITFSNAGGLFTVNGNMTVTVSADIICGGSSPCESDSGQTVGVQLTGVTLSGNSVASGVPISGNLFNVSSAPTLASVQVSGLTPTGSPTTNPQTGVVVWQANFAVNQTSVNMTRMALREIGSINLTSIGNFQLMVDGKQVAQTQSLDTNSYVTFAVSPAVLLSTGNHTVQVLADVNSGASRTFSFSLQNNADLGLIDTSYNVGVAITGNVVAPITAGTFTVNSATNGFTVQKSSDSPSSNVSYNGSGVTLARWAVISYGEPIKIQTLNVGFTYTNNGDVPQVSTDTFTGTGTTTPAVTINGHLITGIIASSTALAASQLITAINNASSVNTVVTASSGGSGIVTITATSPAPTFTITENSTNGGGTLAGAVATTTAGGTYNAAATLRNGQLFFGTSESAMSAYGSEQTVVSGGTTQFNTNYVVQPGTTTYIEFRADIYDNDGTGQFSNGDTLQMTLPQVGTTQNYNNAQGQTSLTTVNLPSASTPANTITITTGSISAVKNGSYGNQTTVNNQTGYHLASFYLNGSSNEPVNLNGITVAFAGGQSAHLHSVKVFYGGYTPGSTANQLSTVLGSVNASGNYYSLSQPLAMNASVPIDIVADLDGTISGSPAVTTSIDVTGTTANSGQAADTGSAQGQAITVTSTGTISVQQDGSSPSPALVIANQQGVPTAAFKLQATNDTFTVTDVTFTVASNTTASTLYLYSSVNGATPALVTQKAVGSGTVVISSLSIPVPASGSTVLSTKVDVGNIGAGQGSPADNLLTTLTGMKVTSSNGGVTAVGTYGGNGSGTFSPVFAATAGNSLYVFKTLPSVATYSGGLPATKLAVGSSQTIYKFTVNAGANPISWEQVRFNVSTSTVTATNFSLVTDGPQTVIANCTPSGGSAPMTVTCVVTSPSTLEQQVGTSQIYDLQATLSGSITTGSSIGVNIPKSSSGIAAPGTTQTLDNSTASFVWSDLSASPHSSNGTSAGSSSDWNNDYLITLSTQTMNISY
jgi:hypothetical protein